MLPAPRLCKVSGVLGCRDVPVKKNCMTELTTRPKERSVTVVLPKKSITEMSVKELNEIDKFQNINRGFMDNDKYRRLSSWKR